MIQEILAFSSFVLAIVYTVYSITKLFFPGKKGQTGSSCSGCGGSCGIKSELRPTYKLGVNSIRESQDRSPF